MVQRLLKGIVMSQLSIPPDLVVWLSNRIAAERKIDSIAAFPEALATLADPERRAQIMSERATARGDNLPVGNYYDRSAVPRLAAELVKCGMGRDAAVNEAYRRVTSPENQTISLRAVEQHQRAVKMFERGEGAIVCCGGVDLTRPTDASPVWNQIAKVGTFRGHPAGPFELSPKVFGEIVANFSATTNKRVPIDFEHASEADESSGSIPSDGAPAQGWILDLQNRGTAGLWGLVEWLEPARSLILAGKYRYFSPAIRFGARDRVTGQTIGAKLTSGALTNQPFLDGLVPVTARAA